MNKDLKQLIYYMLNEDLLSDLEDNTDDDSEFMSGYYGIKTLIDDSDNETNYDQSLDVNFAKLIYKLSKKLCEYILTACKIYQGYEPDIKFKHIFVSADKDVNIEFYTTNFKLFNLYIRDNKYISYESFNDVLFSLYIPSKNIFALAYTALVRLFKNLNYIVDKIIISNDNLVRPKELRLCELLRWKNNEMTLLDEDNYLQLQNIMFSDNNIEGKKKFIEVRFVELTIDNDIICNTIDLLKNSGFKITKNLIGKYTEFLSTGDDYCDELYQAYKKYKIDYIPLEPGYKALDNIISQCEEDGWAEIKKQYNITNDYDMKRNGHKIWSYIENDNIEKGKNCKYRIFNIKWNFSLSDGQKRKYYEIVRSYKIYGYGEFVFLNQINENIKCNIKRVLNEDLLSDLEDDNDDDSDFIISDRNIIKIFNGKPDVKFMNSYNKIGDLLTYYSDNLFYIIKNNKSIDEIKKGLNTEYYGKIIGMCVGNGLWMSTEFNYLKKYIWANEESNLYNHNVDTFENNGWHNTNYIWNNYSREINNTIWQVLYDQEIDGLGKHICYLPSLNQLKEIYKNNNIIKINETRYWSSSQYPDYYNFAFSVYFYRGSVSGSVKSYNYRSLALLYFE